MVLDRNTGSLIRPPLMRPCASVGASRPGSRTRRSRAGRPRCAPPRADSPGFTARWTPELPPHRLTPDGGWGDCVRSPRPCNMLGAAPQGCDGSPHPLCHVSGRHGRDDPMAGFRTLRPKPTGLLPAISAGQTVAHEEPFRIECDPASLLATVRASGHLTWPVRALTLSGNQWQGPGLARPRSLPRSPAAPLSPHQCRRRQARGGAAGSRPR